MNEDHRHVVLVPIEDYNKLLEKSKDPNDRAKTAFVKAIDRMIKEIRGLGSRQAPSMSSFADFLETHKFSFTKTIDE